MHLDLSTILARTEGSKAKGSGSSRANGLVFQACCLEEMSSEGQGYQEKEVKRHKAASPLDNRRIHNGRGRLLTNGGFLLQN